MCEISQGPNLVDIKACHVHVYDTRLQGDQRSFVFVVIDKVLHDTRRYGGQSVIQDVWFQVLEVHTLRDCVHGEPIVQSTVEEITAPHNETVVNTRTHDVLQ